MTISLDQIFSVKHILKSRGFNVKKEGNGKDLLLKNFVFPKRNYGGYQITEEVKLLYQVFNKTTWRKELKNKIENPKYSPSCMKVNDLLRVKDFVRNRQRFSKTFEWYVGELMIREFDSLSASYGVEVDDIQKNVSGAPPGDFDVLVIMRDTSIVYFECKTGELSNFKSSELLKCIERMVSLHCDFSIIIVDSKLDENLLAKIINYVDHPLYYPNRLLKFRIKGVSEYIYDYWGCYFISATKDIEKQLKIILRINEAKKFMRHEGISWSEKAFDRMGYDYTEIPIE